jgi:hypothetical protein
LLTSTSVPKNGRMKKAKTQPPSKKLPYHMTDEELHAEMSTNVKRQVAPKRPPRAAS